MGLVALTTLGWKSLVPTSKWMGDSGREGRCEYMDWVDGEIMDGSHNWNGKNI